MNSLHKKILLASPRGYCAGVERAIVAVERALAAYGPPIYVRGQIVHNTYVVSTLEQKGAIFVNDLRSVPKDGIVVFSAHGVSPAVREEAASLGLSAIDATCPLVSKVHKEAARFDVQGREVLLIGHRDHEEVEGTKGHITNVQIIEDINQAKRVQVKDPNNLAWVSQTTLSVDETYKIVSVLRERFPAILSPPSSDICYATQNRQDAVKQIAKEADVVIVVGSANSSNSVRLVEVALQSGARFAYRIDKAQELQDEWVHGARTIGVTSGASVPEVLVEQVLEMLAAHGFMDVIQFDGTKKPSNFPCQKSFERGGRGREKSCI